MISNEQVNVFSKRLSIDSFTVIREYLQIVFLSALYASKNSEKVVFKGGTAISLILKSGRYSEDLDFTSTLSVAELDFLVNDVAKKMAHVVEGISLKRTEEKERGFTGILSYRPPGMRHPLNLHLDFSMREKPETRRETVLETDFPVLPLPVIVHMEWEEILAEKIRAFLFRDAGRDMYDLYFLLQQGVALDWPMINRKTAMYGMKATLGKLSARVDEFEDKMLQNDLRKFLPTNSRGMVDQLKSLTLTQLRKQVSFVISQSRNVEYSKMPGETRMDAEAVVKYDLDKTRIVSFIRIDQDTIEVVLRNVVDTQEFGYIRARNSAGVRELDVVQRAHPDIVGKSYDFLIRHEFAITPPEYL